jgi:hypothetical protein
MKKIQFFIALIALIVCSGITQAQSDPGETPQYKMLATMRTGTMQKELDQVAAQGYRILVGSPTAGAEMALFLSREATAEKPYQYKLLATTLTSTMQKELSQMAKEGYRLIPSTMISKQRLLGGPEIVMIMERVPWPTKQYEYKLLATSLTHTLQKEVTETQAAGFRIVGMVSRGEHMVVMERETDTAAAKQ